VFYSFDSDAKEEWLQSGGWIRHIICLDHNNKESTQEKVSRTPKVDMVNWTRMQKKNLKKKTKKEFRNAGGSRKLLSISRSNTYRHRFSNPAGIYAEPSNI
jgi:hypothetical protein